MMVMDRETTHRLLRESIVFLCKTHLGSEAVGGFEVDSIICVSRCGGNRNVRDDPRPIVFKFHELITDEEQSVLDEPPNLSLISPDNCVASAHQGVFPALFSIGKRKTDKYQEDLVKLASKKVSGGDHSKTVNGANDGLDLVKKERDSFEGDVGVPVPVGVHASKTKASNVPSSWTTGDKSEDNCADHLGLPLAKDCPSLKNQAHSTTSCLSADLLQTDAGSLSRCGPRKSVPSLEKRPNSSMGNIKDSCLPSGSSFDRTDESTAEIDPVSSMEQLVPRTCDICQQNFVDFPTFNVHYTTYHERFACPFCEQSFTCESSRERHLFEHTGEPVDDDSAGNMPVSSIAVDSYQQSWFTNQYGNMGSEAHSSQSSTIEILSDNEDDTLSSNGSFADSHVRSRRGTISTQALRAIASLDPARPFVCDVCRAQFEEPQDLCDHCTSKHHRVPCPFCGRSFSQKASMERHQRQHTGVRPYRCPLCPMSYTRKENLQTHVSRAHSMSKGKPLSVSDSAMFDSYQN